MTARPTQFGIIGAAAVMFLFSFFDATSDGGSMWSDFGIQTMPVLIALLAGVVTALDAFATVDLPDELLGLRRSQWLIVLALPAVLIMIGLVMVLKNASALSGETIDVEPALWISLLASIGLLVSAVLDDRAGDAPATQSAAPTAF